MLIFGNDTQKEEQEGRLSILDRELQLLLGTTRDFLEKKAYEQVDWETVIEKYVQFLRIFVSNLPYEVSRKNFQHSG